MVVRVALAVVLVLLAVWLASSVSPWLAFLLLLLLLLFFV